MFKKPRHVTISSRFLVWIFLCQKVRQWLPLCVLHGGSHCLTFWRRNIQTKNLDDGNDNIFFLSEGLAVWRLSRNQFKPVWDETVKNYPARKQELLSSQNRNINHQCGILKIMGKAIFFVEWSLLIKVPAKALEAAEAKQKLSFFYIHVNYFLFWKK